MKGGREHRVPLSDAAIAVLKAAQETQAERLRIPRREGSETAIDNVLDDDAGAHGPKRHVARLPLDIS